MDKKYYDYDSKWDDNEITTATVIALYLQMIQACKSLKL